MKPIRLRIIVGILGWVTICVASSTQSAPAAKPVILIDDVARFYRVYDAAGVTRTLTNSSATTSIPVQRGFTTSPKFETSRALPSPRLWTSGRKSIRAPSAAWRSWPRRAPARWRQHSTISPASTSGGESLARDDRCRSRPARCRRRVPSGEGVQIGLEALCAVSWLNPKRRGSVRARDRSTNTPTSSNRRAFPDDEHPTVLRIGSHRRVGAEFIAELVPLARLGTPSSRRRPRAMKRKSKARFVHDEDKTRSIQLVQQQHLGKSPATSVTGSGIGSPNPTTGMPPTSAGRCAKSCR